MKADDMTGMAEPKTERHYEHSPITEAVIEIRVAPKPDLSLASLTKVGDRLPAFSERLEAAMVTKEFSLEGTSERTEKRATGWIFRTPEKKDVLQALAHGFALSRLQPYESWRQFRERGQEAWKVYKEIAEPSSVVRLAVRYINRFEFPHPVTNLGRYLTVLPTAPAILSLTPVETFLIQLRSRFEDLDARLVLNEAIVPPRDQSHLSLVLDLDVFREGPLVADDEQVWEHLHALHQRAEDVFEGCITDETRKLIQ